MNVFALFQNAAAAWGDKPAVRFGARCQSYRDLDSAAESFAGYLIDLGLKPGDRVALFMKNGFLYPAAMLGAFRGGFVVVPINAKLHIREAAFIVENSGATVIVVDPQAHDSLAAAVAPESGVTFIVAGPSSGDDALETLVYRRPRRSAPVDIQPDDPAWLFYTSGTTGRPKGAVLSHRNLTAMAVNCLADICAFRPDDKLLHAAPLSHGSGLYIIPALSRGAENIIDSGETFDPNRIMRLIAKERVTVLPFLAPTMIVRLLDAEQTILTPNLRAMIYGGAPIHIEHLRAAIRRFGPVLIQLYGQGESPMTISYLPTWMLEKSDDEALRSAGLPRSGVQITILDDEGHARSVGEVGEIAVRGDVVMRGYWRNEDANIAAFVDGWLKTGDVGKFDPQGRLHLLDRRHDTIISGGSNIYPREVEEVLTAHPAVREASVFGVPDPEWGEIVVAAVVAREPASNLNFETLIAHCRDNLASFKKPKKIIFCTDLPKNAYGKVLRRELRDRFSLDAKGRPLT
jgi:acyl-CoA synthetase (AMP-forming)/AMP-acid ligase II